MSTTNAPAPWSRDEFTARLRALETGYHIHHPFNRLLTSGELSRDAVQAWVLNRFYYQRRIPQKDAALLANCPDREVRRLWAQRILEHDGQGSSEGGIERWLRLAAACGLDRAAVESGRAVLPAVRFAVDAYVNFVRTAPWQEAVTSSLTELFAPSIHRERLSVWPARYPWIEAHGLDYFRERLDGAHRDSTHGLQVTLDFCDTHARQVRALEIVEFKLDVLWSILDALHLVHVLGVPPRPRHRGSLDE